METTLSTFTRSYSNRLSLFIFSLTLFMGASLLFVVQPMVAKQLLPIFGGTPAVWTVCVLFFQSGLLVAYLYAWALSRLFNPIAWRMIHLLVCLISLYALPLHLSATLSGTNDPALLILKTLFLQLGLPLFVVSSSAPLLQYAFSRTASPNASNPYFLYVASNVGSLLALLAYPGIIERITGLTLQFQIWNTLYAIYIAFVASLLLFVKYQPISMNTNIVHPINLQTKATWVGLSFIPCSLMLGVTFYISTDVAASPLFWIIPLALYLLSFIITFSNKTVCPRPLNHGSDDNHFLNKQTSPKYAWMFRLSPFFIILPFLGFIFGVNRIPAWEISLVNLVSFFLIALAYHGSLVLKKPPAEYLTSFYVHIATGGMLAGIFNGLIAPHLFVHAYEYPFVLLVGFYFLPFHKQSGIYRGWYDKKLLLTVGLFFFIFLQPWFGPATILSQERNFYGIKRVFSKNNTHYLMNQTTLHGYQIQANPENMNGAVAYYGPILPIVRQLQSLYQPLRASILGLGTGTLLCQFKKQDQVNFVEIDPQIIRIASSPTLFSYLRDCPSQAHIIERDGRLAMADMADASNELVIMDTFSSDAIPVHMLTQEAFTLYQKKLTSQGVILINISNRNINALPVITSAAHQLDFILLYKNDPGNSSKGQLASQWALLTTNESLANHLIHTEGWHFVTDQTSLLWTDDYSNIIPLLKLR